MVPPLCHLSPIEQFMVPASLPSLSHRSSCFVSTSCLILKTWVRMATPLPFWRWSTCNTPGLRCYMWCTFTQEETLPFGSWFRNAAQNLTRPSPEFPQELVPSQAGTKIEKSFPRVSASSHYASLPPSHMHSHCDNLHNIVWHSWGTLIRDRTLQATQSWTWSLQN